MSDADRRLYLLLAAVSAAVLAAIWLTGALAGLLFGGGWIAIGTSDLGTTALRLPAHLGDPRAAWPAEARAALPGAAGFYLSAAILAAVACGIFVLARRAPLPFDPHWPGSNGRRVPSARWAKARDLAPLRVPERQVGRLTLGRLGRTLLAAEERQSVIVFGPTQTHKTSGLAIPALLEWQGPVLATSVKSDLLATTLARREALGEVMVFDPAQVTGMETARATPLRGARSWAGAMEVADALAAAARTGGGGLQDADFWYAAAAKLLAPLLFAAASSERTMEAVVRWLDEGPERNEEAIGELLKKAGEKAALRAYQATQNREERQRGSVYTTAETILAAFADPRVIEETAASDYTPKRLLDGKSNTLYLCAPRQQQGRLRPLFSLLVQELMAEVEARELHDRRPLDPPLLLLLDECANIAPVPALDEIASTAAGLGVQLLTVFQDLAQVEARWGKRATSIVNNHRGKLIGNSVSDRETLTYLSRLLGAGEFEQRSVSRNRGERMRHSETQGDTYRDLAPANLVRERRPGSALLVYGHLPPAQIALRPWFEDRELSGLSEGSTFESRPDDA